MRLDLPNEKQLVYTTTFKVRWGDMDALGHVNNAMYFKYMEHARVDWMAQLGFASEANNTGPVIVNAFCNFLQQLVYPDEVLLKMYVSNPGRSTMDTWVTMERVQAPDVLCATGGATVVWADYAQQKSVALPERVRALLTGAAPVSLA